MVNPVSINVLKEFQWKGKRLTMKFEGGWSTASYKRACNRRETPEGYDMFYYKDKDRLYPYSKQYVFRRNGAAGGSYGGVGNCGRF